MSVSQNIDPRTCPAWIYGQLNASSTLQALCGHGGVLRAYQDASVPTPDEGIVYPYIYWSGGAINQTQFYDRERETWGVIHSRYVVRAVKRFDGRADWDAFVPFYQEFRRVLTGIRARPVVLGGAKIGDVWSSRFVSPFAHEDQDGEARLLESGILIEISHL